MGMAQPLMQILEMHIFECLKITSSSFLCVPLVQTKMNPCFVFSSLFCQKMGLKKKRLSGCCVCTHPSIMILTVSEVGLGKNSAVVF